MLLLIVLFVDHCSTRDATIDPCSAARHGVCGSVTQLVDVTAPGYVCPPLALAGHPSSVDVPPFRPRTVCPLLVQRVALGVGGLLVAEEVVPLLQDVSDIPCPDDVVMYSSLANSKPISIICTRCADAPGVAAPVLRVRDLANFPRLIWLCERCCGRWRQLENTTGSPLSMCGAADKLARCRREKKTHEDTQTDRLIQTHIQLCTRKAYTYKLTRSRAYTYPHTHTHRATFPFTHGSMMTHTCIPVPTYAGRHAHSHAFTRIHARSSAFTYTFTHIHIHIQKHIHALLHVTESPTRETNRMSHDNHPAATGRLARGGALVREWARAIATAAPAKHVASRAATSCLVTQASETKSTNAAQIETDSAGEPARV